MSERERLRALAERARDTATEASLAATMDLDNWYTTFTASMNARDALLAELSPSVVLSLLAALDEGERRIADLIAAAEEVNARYIGGSPLKGRLGDALETLADTYMRARAATRTEAPPMTDTDTAAKRVRAALADLPDDTPLMQTVETTEAWGGTDVGERESGATVGDIRALLPLPLTGVEIRPGVYHVAPNDGDERPDEDEFTEAAPPRATTPEPTHRCACGLEGDFSTVMAHGITERHMFGPVEVMAGLRASLSAAPSANRGPLRGALEFYANEEWRHAHGRDDCSATLRSFAIDPDDERVRVRSIADDDALLAELRVAAPSEEIGPSPSLREYLDAVGSLTSGGLEQEHARYTLALEADAREAERLRAAAMALVTHHDTYGVIPSGLIDTLRASLPTPIPESNK